MLYPGWVHYCRDLERACAEMKRVLKKDGVMVHSVPTVWCNFVTMIVQPTNFFFEQLYFILKNFYIFFERFISAVCFSINRFFASMYS